MFIPTDFQLYNGRHGLRSTNYRHTLFRQSRIPRKAKRAANEETKPGYLCWGRAGSLPSGEAVSTVGFEVHREVSRETTPIRIENPDDPSQYVDALQTDKMKLQKNDTTANDNSKTKDADLTDSGFAPAEEKNFKTAASPASSGAMYTIEFKPPERAV